MGKLYLLEVYVPETNAEAVRAALAESKAGAIGNYDSCCFSIKGSGRFRPLEGANPHIGSINRVEVVDEVKIEVIVREEVLVNSLTAVRAAHPYEEPAIIVTEVQDYKNFLPKLDALPQPVKKTIPPMSIVLEGLDGVGKSTVAVKLAAELLGAKHMVTPPAIMLPAREWFVQQDGAMRKAYYMVGNFIAGTEMRNEVAAGRCVVLDRYYASTMAYILGKKDVDLPLPAQGAEEYAWPAELHRPTFMCALVLPEADRIARRQSRTSVPETPEERLLRETPAIPTRINEVYARMGCTQVLIAGSDSVEVVVRKVLDAVNAALGCDL